MNLFYKFSSLIVKVFQAWWLEISHAVSVTSLLNCIITLNTLMGGKLTLLISVLCIWILLFTSMINTNLYKVFYCTRVFQWVACERSHPIKVMVWQMDGQTGTGEGRPPTCQCVLAGGTNTYQVLHRIVFRIRECLSLLPPFSCMYLCF